MAAWSSDRPCSVAMSVIPESSMNASYVPDSGPGAVISSGASGKPPFPPTSLGERVGAVPRVDALGLRAEQRVQVAGVEARHRAVLWVGHDRDAVVRDRELDVVDTPVGARRLLVVLDRTRRVGDVGLALAEEHEPVTGAGAVDAHLHVGVLLGEQLGHQVRDGKNGRRSRHGDRAGEISPAGALQSNRWSRRLRRRRTHRRPRRSGKRRAPLPRCLPASSRCACCVLLVCSARSFLGAIEVRSRAMLGRRDGRPVDRR